MTVSKPTPWQRYQADLEHPDFSHDPAQEQAVRALDDLYQRLLRVSEEPPRRGGLLSRIGLGARPRQTWPRVTGLYLWGGVGRGKTYLVDIFHDSLTFPEKRRLHFHRFMQMVHHRLRDLERVQDPLDVVAREFARDTRVLCFDEFFVSDITDAMLLAGLLRGLFREGVTLVATSNIPPAALYKDGLQRERFLPAIDLLREHTEVMEVAGDTDYRLRFLEQAELYHWPLDEAADEVLNEEFVHLAPDTPEFNTALQVEGRSISARGLADDVAWFDFAAICDGPRGQADYIELARTFHSVLVSNVPALDETRENQARRFIAMVDEFYDHGVKLILSAEVPLESLYQGKRLQFEFERTRSRLQEMQSQAYLAGAHWSG